MVRDRMRCLLENTGASWQAYCVDVDLCSTGASAAEARLALDRLLERYCYEIDEGSKSARALRRGSCARILRYWTVRSRQGGSEPDPSRQRISCYVFDAPPQLLTGLA